MLKALENDPQATGLYIFPTKALAQDQMRALGAVLGRCEELEDVKVCGSSFSYSVEQSTDLVRADCHV